MGLIVVIAVVFALLASPASAANAGFEEIKIANDAEEPLTIGVWYATDAPDTKHYLGDLIARCDMPECPHIGGQAHVRRTGTNRRCPGCGRERQGRC